MVCLDLDIANFQPKNTFEKKQIEQADDIIEWLLYLQQHKVFGNLLEFLNNLTIYYRKKGIKLLVIWDQINVMENELYKNEMRPDNYIKKLLHLLEFLISYF